MMRRFLSFSFRFLAGPVLLATLVLPGMSLAQLTPEPTQAPAASPAAQRVADLQKVVDRWDDAVGQRDQYALELVLAPRLLNISEKGEVQTRDQVISELVAHDAPRYSLEQKVVNVREVGDVAVVTGTYDRHFDGSRLSRTKAKDQEGVFSQVYVRARNSWECINSQRTLVAETTGRHKKKSKAEYRQKPLHHDLGFHLPGLHHSSDDSQPQ